MRTRLALLHLKRFQPRCFESRLLVGPAEHLCILAVIVSRITQWHTECLPSRFVQGDDQ